MKAMISLLLLGIVGAIDLAILLKLSRTFGMLKVQSMADGKADELPSVTICIPARNETHAMTQCLERVVASDYPKLEVIVLDDRSGDDTSILIKSFAHSGVRFIEGGPLPDGWLGKNYAQSVLADEASGKYVFFMDVDTLVERFTVRRAVEYMLRNKAKMISIVPMRNDHWQGSTLMATMRYFWTLMRFRPSRPRAASNAWVIERDLLNDELRDDTQLATSLMLETTIARRLYRQSAYRLAISNPWLGLRYEKKWSSQVETSIRLIYPQCGMNVLNAIGLVLMLVLVLSPYVIIWWQPWAVPIIALQYVIAYYYLSHVWLRYRLAGALIFPFTIIQEIILIIISAYRYEFGVITWKGRPISKNHIS